MTELLLKRELEPLAEQQRRVKSLRYRAVVWAVAAAVACAVLVLLQFVPLPGALLLCGIGLAAVIAAFAAALKARAVRPDYADIARNIERQKPELHALLLTAVEQQRDAATGRLGYLQERVIRDALVEIRKQQRLEAVPRAQMRTARLLHAAALVAFLVLLFAVPRSIISTTHRPLFALDRVTVTPGDANIEKGSSLVVLAKFEGRAPTEATLVIATNGGEARITLVKNLNDPVFGGGIPEVAAPFTYRVEYGTDRTEDFKITVFEHPRLERADATIEYPNYTGLEQKRIQDTRRVTAVEGALVDVALQLNKPVKTARLIGKDKSVLDLTTLTNQAQAHLNGFQFTSSQTYDLQLIDTDGRSNKLATQFVFEVLTNQRPRLKIASPRGDPRVSPLQEVLFQAEAQDDYGLGSYGLTYSIGGEEPKTLQLGDSAPANVKTNFAHLLRLEDINAEVDQLISFFVWADDVGPDGKVRRTSSDMFFAEVRPFEEIYREGQGGESEQQQQQQQQQGQSPATKLAELQKQIINATWKLQRQETGAKPSAQYLKDEPVVRESQERALGMGEAMDEQLRDYRMKEYLQTALKHMQAALEQLTEATNSVAPLPKALAAEQAAYQALLKLQAREFQVVQSRSQSRGQQQASQQRNQSQLDQLEMKQSQNRYETQREAAPPMDQEQQEQLEVLSRLKELAQRQEDINEKLKDLQTALQQAKTEPEKEEIRRELKRLREEQREMLADMDELQQRMEQSQNQEQMAQSREQLDQARQEAQRASEALENESVPQALASGTRAERQLEEMRDDFRKRNSSQFADEMRQMRDEARELAEREQNIRKEMEELQDKPKSLSDGGQSQQLASKFNEQKQAVTNLLSDIKRVTEQSENAEPLLSKQLYDTLRKNSQGNLDQALAAAEELTKRNFLREAKPFEERAAKEIESLKKDVEQAAQSVLGDETEALRMAKRELDDLTAQLQRELARAAATNAAATNLAGGAQRSTSGVATNAVAAGMPGTNGGPGSLAGRGTNASPFAAGVTNGSAMAGVGTNGSLRGAAGTNASNRELASGRGNQNQSGRERTGSENSQEQQPGSTPGQQGAGGQQQTASAGQQPGSENQQQGQQGGAGGQGQRNNRADRITDLFNRGNASDGGGGNGGSDWNGPITGGNEFTEWNQRLSNVEEMVDQPALRNQLAQVRDRARAVRAEFKRNSKSPKWDLVNLEILKPLVEVRERIADELSRRESSESLAPIDRDPVPNKYGELVRRYYETLGNSQ